VSNINQFTSQLGEMGGIFQQYFNNNVGIRFYWIEIKLSAFTAWKFGHTKNENWHGGILRIYGKQDGMEDDLDGFQINLGRRTRNVI